MVRLLRKHQTEEPENNIPEEAEGATGAIATLEVGNHYIYRGQSFVYNVPTPCSVETALALLDDPIRSRDSRSGKSRKTDRFSIEFIKDTDGDGVTDEDEDGEEEEVSSGAKRKASAKTAGRKKPSRATRS